MLGKSERQVRYLIQTGRLAGTKAEGRWQIPAEALAKRPERRERTAEKLEALRAVVEQALPAGGTAAPWSVTNMRAVKSALELHRAMVEAFSPAAPEADAVARAVRSLVRGGHAFQRQDKRASYQDARLAACDALSALLLRGTAPALALVEQTETSLLPALSGLVRRAETGRGPR